MQTENQGQEVIDYGTKVLGTRIEQRQLQTGLYRGRRWALRWYTVREGCGIGDEAIDVSGDDPNASWQSFLSFGVAG